MRCKACDTLLSDYEATRKSSVTGEFIDMCNTCYKEIKDDVQVIENTSLISLQDYIDILE